MLQMLTAVWKMFENYTRKYFRQGLSIEELIPKEKHKFIKKLVCSSETFFLIQK